MTATRGLGLSDGMFQSTLEMQEANLTKNKVVSLRTDTVIQFLRVDADDKGAGVLLDNGLFANLLISVDMAIDTPVNVSPDDLAVDVNSTPTLTASVFAGTDPKHIHSIWNVYSDAGLTTLVYTSGTSDDLESHTTTALPNETQLWWTVQYVGVSSISDASAATSFTTEAGFSSLFATTLYMGNSSTQDIISDLDFVAKDGLVWMKARNGANSHVLTDTVRGAGYWVASQSTSAEAFHATVLLSSFNSDGFSLGSDVTINGTGLSYVAWQFMKQQGFFDIVEYVGDGIAGRTVAIDLDDGTAEFGMSIVKDLDNVGSWYVQHKSLGGTQNLLLETTSAAITSSSKWNNTDGTNVALTLGGGPTVNGNGVNYISYNFAHNPSKGIFCGSYTGTGTAGNKMVTGFPVGWSLFKATSTTSGWDLFDIVRGDFNIQPNTSGVEGANAAINFLSDGFEFSGANDNALGVEYIFVAIADPAQF